LLHAIAGLIAPTRGHITLDTHRLGELDDDAVTLLRRRRVGFVFQAFFLVEVLTARENIALPLVLDGVDESTANRRAEALLERLGLSGRGGHLPAQLSGGEKQRVAIARAIVHQPLLLLADEPTGNLDSTSGAEVMRLLRDCVDTERVSVLMVTHDIRCAAHADRIVRLRDGRVVADQKLSGSRTPSDVLRMLGEGW
jgi:putative ABC transport system ATP-binding protein